MATYTFHVSGMHCASCVVLTESALKDAPGIKSAKSSLKHNTIEVSGDFAGQSASLMAERLNAVLKPHGYSLSTEPIKKTVTWGEFKIALPLALVFVAAFIVLQKLGVVNLVNTDNVGYGTAFAIGLIASVSTCMAVVGGLVLSLSSSFAKSGDPGSTSSLRSADYGASKIQPPLFFHAGRLVAFFMLGGVIGALGAVFQLGSVGTLVLGLAVALVLIVLGINLLDVLPKAKVWQVVLPKSLSAKIHGLKNLNHRAVPFLAGVATFFLPCGFTQSMQIYTLSTGNFWTGGLTMLVFALGTLPVLALLSFGSVGIHKKAQSGVFFKTAGLVVILFGVINLINSLAAFGVIPPLLNF